MPGDFALMPPIASTLATDVDVLLGYFAGIGGFFMVLIFLLVPLFAYRYRRRHPDEVPPPPGTSINLELMWTAVPFAVVMSLFVWGAKLYVHAYTPPEDAMEIFVTGKQWMWKVQHPDGRKEINTLHVPVGQPVKLTLTSEDVIHSFYIPAFRTKKDVVPGQYTQMWFEATKPGRYHLFCAEYCGANHSRMVGSVIVMTVSDYQLWLSGEEQQTAAVTMPGEAPTPSMARAGQQLFIQHGCVTCHTASTGPRGPSLEGIYGRTVRLRGGATVVADDNYLRESILNPQAKIVAGYDDVLMPNFSGLISEEGVAQLIAYLRRMHLQERSPQSPDAPAPALPQSPAAPVPAPTTGGAP